MSGQPEINTSLMHPETCQEGQMNPWNRGTSWVGLRASAKGVLQDYSRKK